MFGKRNTNNTSEFGRKLNNGGVRTFGTKGSNIKIGITPGPNPDAYKKPILEK